MLVLSRKLGEEIRIGGDMTVKVLSIRGHRVKLGFCGPAHVPICRGELTTASKPSDVPSLRELVCAEER